jgi:hypothetical protein
MDVEHEINRLAAETAVLQVLLTQFLKSAASIDGPQRQAVMDAFDNAAQFLDVVAIKFGKAGNPQHTLVSIKILEQLRRVVLPDELGSVWGKKNDESKGHGQSPCWRRTGSRREGRLAPPIGLAPVGALRCALRARGAVPYAAAPR